LHAAQSRSRIGPGDEVIVPSVDEWLARSLAVLHSAERSGFFLPADIDPQTWNAWTPGRSSSASTSSNEAVIPFSI